MGVLKSVKHQTQLCVIGGGLGGMLTTYASEMVSDTYGSATAHIFAFKVR